MNDSAEKDLASQFAQTSRYPAIRDFSRCGCGYTRAKPSSDCCVSVKDTPINRPDLAIYSQSDRLNNGQSASWDSPDITTNSWRPFRLRKEVLVKVRNLSSTPAINALVNFYTSPFGIGTPRTLRISQKVNVGGGQELSLLFPLHEEVLSGDPRTGVHIDISHPMDENPLNNSGSQVHDGGFTTESGRSFDVRIPVVNNSGAPRRIDLSIQPTDLSASLSLTSHNFAPFEQIETVLSITVPSFITDTGSSPVLKDVTVIGRDGNSGALIGGATRLLKVDD